MSKLRKILFILLVLILIVACAAYVDYYVVKTRNTTPKISIKEELDENLVVYNAIMYRVWYCKTNKKYTIGDYKDSQVVCLPKDTYDDSGNYTNKENVLIMKYDLDLIKKYYDEETISTMTSEEVENAKLLVNEYAKLQYKVLDTEEAKQIKLITKYDMVIFPTYKLNDGNEYELVYDEEKMYCINDNEEISLYEDNICGEFSKISLDTKVCEIYKETSLKDDKLLSKLCEE